MRKQLFLLLFLWGWLIVGARTAWAAGVVGNGDSASCTEAAFTTALRGGGSVTFACGKNAATISLSADKVLTTTTQIDGGGKVTLSGGALQVSPSTTLTVTNLTIAGSPRAAIVNNGGTVTIKASNFISNSNLSGDGGAIVNQNNGALTISTTTFANNRATNGGAIYSASSATVLIDDSDFTDNQAANGNGGAILLAAQHSMVTISKTTFFSNEAAQQDTGAGGALAINENAQVTLVNDTIVGNHGAGSINGGGHALYLKPGALVNATNTTIAYHLFDRGAAAHNFAIWGEGNARLVFANTLLFDSGCDANLTSQGHNLTNYSSENCGITNVQNTSFFDMYDTNGGRHITYMPRKDGPAKDAGDNALCPAIDQRGISRPQGAKCDIGAIEYAVPSISTLSPAAAMVRGSDFVLTVTGQNLLEGMIVQWNGHDLATTWVSTTQLKAVVPAAYLTQVGTVTITVRTPNRQIVNTLPFQIEEQAAVQLGITVGTQAGTCSTQTSLTVTQGARVVVCYTLRNTGSLTLTRHTLVDSVLGSVLQDDPIEIPAGGVFTELRTMTATVSFVNNASLSSTAVNGSVVQAGASATVNVINPKLSLAVTVGTQADACATTKEVLIRYGGNVTFCYTITNKGDAPLDLHTLTDAKLGKLFENVTQVVAPNASYAYLKPYKPERSAKYTATWTARNSALPDAAQIASDEVTVNIIEQDYREVGALRIWADQFITETNGSISATSRVRIGPKSQGTNSKYFSVNTSVNWSGDGPVTGTGLVGTADGDVALIEGGFSIATTTGEITWQPNAITRYAFIGDSFVQVVNPTLAFNVLQPLINGSGRVQFSPVGNEPTILDLTFTINVDGTVTSAATAITLQIGGTTLTGQVSADAHGMRITQAVLALPTPGDINLSDLIIDGRDDTGMRFANDPAALPDLDLGNGVLVLKGLTGKIARANNALTLVVAGKLVIDQIPDNPTIETPVSGLQLLDKKFQGGIGSQPQLIVENFPLQFVGTALKAKPLGAGFEYYLQSSALKLGVPTKWDIPFVGDRMFDISTDGVISTQAPILRVLGDRVPVPQTINLLGGERKSYRVHLTDVKATIKYAELGIHWSIELEGTVNFKIGKDNAFAPGVKFIFKGGKVSAMLTAATIKVTGLQLKVKDMAYIDDVFSASNARLTLPQAWGGFDIAISKVRIDDNGLKFGEADGKFPIPDFGLFDVLRFTNSTAILTTDAKTVYTVSLTTTLTISNVEVLNNNSASATGNLTISNGRVGGNVSGFGFKLVGIGFRADKAQFVDDRIKAEVVTISLPQNLGGAATSLHGLEIGGPVGFAVRGGTFKLPDFTVGTVGFKNVNAQFERDADGNYLIGAGAHLGFEAFAVEGEFKLAYLKVADKVQVRRVFLAYEGQIAAGTAIPIADTGFFITRVSGSFDLTDETLTVALGVRAAEALEVAGKSALAVEGQVIVQAKPTFKLTTNATTYLVGLKVNQANLVITSHSIQLDSSLEYQVYRATMQLAFGKDAEDELTMFGSMYAEVGLKKGTIGEIDLGIYTVKIPPFDMVLTGEGWQAGKFRHKGQKIWGGRIIRSLFGFNAFVLARFAPGIGVDAGFNLDSYQPVLPAPKAAGLTATAPLPYSINVTNTTDTLVVLEAITTTNWVNPQNIQVTSPNGVPFTVNLEYASPDDQVTRIYTIKLTNPQQAVGNWQIQTQAGNKIAVWGVDQPPVVNSFDAAANNNVTLAAAGAQPQAFNNNAFTFNWSASNNEPNFAVDLYAEAAGGMRYLIAHQESTKETTLTGNKTWTPALPSGIYTPTLVVDDFRNMPVVQHKAPIVIQDTTAPAAPQALGVQGRADGSALLTWNGAAAEADVAGYAVAVDSGAPLRQLGKFAQYEVFGLTSGTTHQIAVAAYDLSGNMGAPAVVTVGLPSVGVNALTPARNGQYSNTISIVFDQAVTPGAFTVTDAKGTNVAGATQLITDEITVEEPITVGLRFIPAAPLAAGQYVAKAQAIGVDGTAVEVSWPFTVLPTLYELTVQVNGSGAVIGQGLNCADACTNSYAAGSAINLTAEPQPGFVFTGWEGACSGAGACQVTMDSAKTVSATFAPIQTHALTVQVSGNGTVVGQGITCGADCTESYAAGTVVNLAALPAQGFLFSGWSGACSGAGACQVTMDNVKTVVATFTQAPPTTYVLSVQVNGNGMVTGQGIDCGADCTESYAAGTVVNLTATPAQGFVFSSWSDACNGAGACQVTMDNAKNVVATFTQAPPTTYALTVQVNGSGTVTGQGIDCGADCTESYAAGTLVTLTANPASGFTFSGWSGACSSTGQCTVTMDNAKTVVATFVQAPPPAANLIYLSGSQNGKIGKLQFNDEDILSFDPATQRWSLIWDGSDVKINGDLDDFAILNDGSILMSFEQPEKVNNLRVDAGDIVRFVPASLGQNTAGRFELYFDGSNVGLTTNGEDIDAFGVLPDGSLLISTRGNVSVPGVNAGPADLLRFVPTQLGPNTAGTWSLYLRGADIGLDTPSESLRSVWVAPDGKLYLTTEGNFAVGDGVSGDSNDILVCTPVAGSTPLRCTFSRFWDGNAYGFNAGFIDGLDIHAPLPLVTSATVESEAGESEEVLPDESDLVDDNDVVDDNEPVETLLSNQLFLPVVMR